MKPPRRPLAIVLLLAASAVLSGSDPGSPDAQAKVIAKVPFRIQQPGLYRLSGDLAYAELTGQAVLIEADNVTIDLGGHTLRGSGDPASFARGLHGNNRHNITITNGEVNGFYFGLDLRCSPAERLRTGSHVVTKVRFARNTYFGLRVEGRQCKVTHCQITDTGGSTNPGHTIPHGARLVGESNVMRDCCIRNLHLPRTADGKGEIVGVHFGAAKDSTFERNQLIEINDSHESAGDASDSKERRFGLWINGGPAQDTLLTVRDNLFVSFTVPIVFSPGADGSAIRNQFHSASARPVRGKPTGPVSGNRAVQEPVMECRHSGGT